MNFLAHAVLSYGNTPILVGNMISDFVKGKKQFDFSIDIQRGIRLHRHIDAYTDSHPVTKQATALFKPVTGLYASVFIDIAYDHFLSRDTQEFQDTDLATFAAGVYKQLYENAKVLPEKFLNILPFMSKQNWLLNYNSLQGIEKSFAGIARRARFLETSDAAFECFRDNYEALETCYHQFFPDLKKQTDIFYNEVMAMV